MQDQFDMFMEAFPDVPTPAAKKVAKTALKLKTVESQPEPVLFVVANEPEKPSCRVDLSTLVISETSVGEPVAKKGYQARCSGIWMFTLVSARAFDSLNDEAKAAMQSQLRERVETAVAA